jgi:DNA-directed RNA polymerase specialized sigma24 family protein
MRPRVTVLPSRRPVAVARRDQREAVARALSGCAARERVLLALLLFERLTTAEAAIVLGIPAARIERAYAALLSQLRELLGGRALRASVPRFATPTARLRRAS